MYRYLDRAIWEIDEPYRFLLAAARMWVGHARSGRCPCAALAAGFAARAAPVAVRDFTMAMVTLDQEGLRTLAFNHRGCITVGEDEAKLLTLFTAAHAGAAQQVRRICATLVADDAVANLATAVEWVALHLRQGIAAEDGR